VASCRKHGLIAERCWPPAEPFLGASRRSRCSDHSRRPPFRAPVEVWDSHSTAVTPKDLSSLETKYPIGGCAQPTEPAQPQRFDLTFRSLKSSDLWSATDEVRYCCGVAGWCGCSHAAPTLSNLNGKGRLEGTLDWYWEGMVPQSGVYRVKPSVCLSHTGYCFADGVVQAGLDALATTIIEPALMLDDELLSFQPFPLAQSVPLATATSRLFPDTAWISGFTTLCSQEIHFRAQQDQFLRLLISVRGVAWTEPGSEADAEVFLSRVGVISNTLSDLDIPAAPF